MFNYKSASDLKNDITSLGIDLSLSDELEYFGKAVTVGGVEIPNSISALPMEGGDAVADGSPGELTFRKYERVAKGGSGLIWIEAVSVCEEGKSNPGQLYINKDNVKNFVELRERIQKAAKQANGENFKPVIIIQLNHSGRYSRPGAARTPIISSHKKELDERLQITEDYPLTTDDYLEEIEEAFVNASILSKEAGFDGVDIKACHGYLINELLSSFNRPGKYGGSFENRSRFMLNVIDKVKAKIADENFLIASRLNLYDALPISPGFGQNSKNELDLTEPIKLVNILSEKGVKIIGVTMGNPYFIPSVNRPSATAEPLESLKGAYRLIDGASQLQKAVPESIVVGVGYSWFRDFAPNVGAAILKEGRAKLIGFGREILAYPDFCNDIIKKGGFERTKQCVACSKCGEMKREISICGCPIRDTEYYLQMYKDIQKNK